MRLVRDTCSNRQEVSELRSLAPNALHELNAKEKAMKKYIRSHGLAPILLLVVLLVLTPFCARYGAALNPLDGCAFPDARSSLKEECRPADWVWRKGENT